MARFADAHAAPPAADALRVGDRVRLTAPTRDAFPIIGFIVSADSAALTVDVASEGEPVSERSIGWNALTRIERFNGYQSNTGRGAWTGLGVGVLIGAGSWYLMAQNSGEVVPPLSTPLWYGGLGALTGALIGSGGSHERWSRIPTDPRMGLQLGTPSAPLTRDVSGGVLNVGDRVRLTVPTNPPSPVVGRVMVGDTFRDVVIGANPDSFLSPKGAAVKAAFKQPKGRVYWFIQK